ncbi:DUF2812 domain-containing protein [Listeria sp. FSL L7-1558]|uniref:DUF2812 domain-containing protein n=1 Tax=Listeria immobilis TaxID=2713502 RepID=UPI001625FC09|nr:DUF2812 domain-containing protein [Listeria immobilis]MBC1483593.1 DUF2812 domain-containing protein [Listeria immobilis]
MEKKVLKFFTVDNMEKEVAYLNEMAKQGWLFTEYKSFRYHFEKGEPATYTYALDFKETTGDEEAYKTLFADAGWEHVYSYPILNGNWMYFRKLATETEVTEDVFTDKESFVHLFQNIRKRWSLFGGLLSLILLFMAIFLPSNSLKIIYAILIVLIIVLYGKMFINLTRKINKLNSNT